MTHVYYCERDNKTIYVIDRKTAPRMGAVITAYGSKWEVFYIEHHRIGKMVARCEPVQ